MDKRYKRNNQVYISGSSAIQLEGNYSNYKERAKKKSKRNKIYHEKSNPVYTLILFFVIITTLAISVILLKAQFAVSDSAGNIIKLQQDLAEIKKKNEQIASDIHKSINMDEVFRIATEELGMVQAGKDDIEFIQAKDVTYTIQYADLNVTKDKTKTNVGNILAFISKGW